MQGVIELVTSSLGLMFLHLQMSLNLIARLRADKQLVILQACRAFFVERDLDEKFKIIASQLTAEPLGLCLLKPEVEYPVVEIEIGVLVHLKNSH